MKIIIVGANGKLGTLICSLLKSETIFCVDVNDDINNISENIDVVIDVSNAGNSMKTLNYCLQHKIPLVVGTTGHNKTQLNQFKLAAKQIAIFLSYNFSIATTIFYKALKVLSKHLKTTTYIIEQHHQNKKDAPSGTAIEIKKLLNNEKTQIISMRGAGKVGKHEVSFMLDNEEITISHQAFSREVFAFGAVKAINFIKDKKYGFYTNKNII